MKDKGGQGSADKCAVEDSSVNPQKPIATLLYVLYILRIHSDNNALRAAHFDNTF